MSRETDNTLRILKNAPIFAALADPMRRELLVNLAEGNPKTATQLSHHYTDITRQGIIKHLNILEDAGLVAVHQAGREKRYTLTPEPLSDLDQWIKALTAKWDERLFRLKFMLENEARTEQAARAEQDESASE